MSSTTARRSLTETQIAELSAFAESLADIAKRHSVQRFRALSSVDNKAAHEGGGAFDPVTEADREVETALRKAIEIAYPDHGIHGEEHGVKPADGPFEWTLDPIDGTRAFVAGIPLWTTLIALSFEDRPMIGVIDQPYLGERYVGVPDASYFRRGPAHRPLKVRPCARLNEAVLSTTDPALFNGAEAGGFEQLRRTAKLTRYGCDAYAYAQLAAGHIDLVVESGLQPYDVRALVPVIVGAGGVVRDWRGEENWNGGQVAAAGDARVLKDAVAVLSRAAD
jgi:myo-inositol-1(or 4)-monophosphatase